MTGIELALAAAIAAATEMSEDRTAELEAVAEQQTTPNPFVEGTRSPLARGNSLVGATGLINTPTAYTAEPNVANVGAGFGEGMRGPNFNYGIIEDIEVGAMWVDRPGASNRVIANGKIHILPANFGWFEIGVGIIDAFDAINQTIYVVGSADLEVPRQVEGDATRFRVHLGAGTGMYNDKLFAGAELQFNNNWSVMGEWDTRDFNGGVRYVHNEDFNMMAGFANTKFFFGMTYKMRL